MTAEQYRSARPPWRPATAATADGRSHRLGRPGRGRSRAPAGHRAGQMPAPAGRPAPSAPGRPARPPLARRRRACSPPSLARLAAAAVPLRRPGRCAAAAPAARGAARAAARAPRLYRPGLAARRARRTARALRPRSRGAGAAAGGRTAGPARGLAPCCWLVGTPRRAGCAGRGTVHRCGVAGRGAPALRAGRRRGRRGAALPAALHGTPSTACGPVGRSRPCRRTARPRDGYARSAAVADHRTAGSAPPADRPPARPRRRRGHASGRSSRTPCGRGLPRPRGTSRTPPPLSGCSPSTAARYGWCDAGRAAVRGTGTHAGAARTPVGLRLPSPAPRPPRHPPRQPAQAAARPRRRRRSALLVAAPVLLVCALAVRLSDGPGVVFRQERIGMDGRPFTLLKFRTHRPADEHGGGDPVERRGRRSG